MDLIFFTKFQRKTNKQHPTATIPSLNPIQPKIPLPKTKTSEVLTFEEAVSKQNASNPHSPPPVRIINDQTTLEPPSPRIE